MDTISASIETGALSTVSSVDSFNLGWSGPSPVLNLLLPLAGSAFTLWGLTVGAFVRLTVGAFVRLTVGTFVRLTVGTFVLQKPFQLGVVHGERVHASEPVHLSEDNPTYRYLALHTTLYREGHVRLDVPVVGEGGAVQKVSLWAGWGREGGAVEKVSLRAEQGGGRGRDEMGWAGRGGRGRDEMGWAGQAQEET